MLVTYSRTGKHSILAIYYIHLLTSAISFKCVARLTGNPLKLTCHNLDLNIWDTKSSKNASTVIPPTSCWH